MSERAISAVDIRHAIAKSKVPVARGHQGALRAVEINGRRLLVKSAHGNPVSSWIRRRMLRREHRAYDRLSGIQGIPRCFGIYDGRYLVLEAIDGLTLRDAVIPDRVSFYRMLFEIIHAMHSLGVSHGDLTRKENILVDQEKRPTLVDFGVSTVYRPGWHPFNHLAFRFFSQHDLNAWLKHKYAGHREFMTAEDACYYRRLLLDEIARRIKRALEPLRRRSKDGQSSPRLPGPQLPENDLAGRSGHGSPENRIITRVTGAGALPGSRHDPD